VFGHEVDASFREWMCECADAGMAGGRVFKISASALTSAMMNVEK